MGVSGPGLITRDDLKTMGPDPIVFAMANPDPEIRPEQAEGAAAVIATGQSDFQNQINNVLCFPGMFRGALDAGATTITEGMKLAAADAIASVVSDDELEPDFIIPSVFDKTVAPGWLRPWPMRPAATASAAHDLVADRSYDAVTFDYWHTLCVPDADRSAPAGWQ